MAHSRTATEPPQPPPFQRRIVISGVQAVGVGALLAVVLAALAGVLGLRPGHAAASDGGLEVQAEFPRILRFRTSLPLAIRVRNAGPVALSRVELRLDRAYLHGFQDVRFTPEPAAITERDVRIVLGDLPAGETREVVASLAARVRGELPGGLQLLAHARGPLELRWSTIVLP